jgi:hypothetical protein
VSIGLTLLLWEIATLVSFALLSSPPLLLIASAVMTIVIVDELKMQNIIPETKSISKNEAADFIVMIYLCYLTIKFT